MRFSFCGNLNDYYHEFHGIRNFFHDHVHMFRTISHSLLGIVISHQEFIILLNNKKT